MESYTKDIDEFTSQAKRYLLTDMFYSLRRFYLDIFFAKEILRFKANDLIIDMGGKKKNKRGQFNIEHYNLKVEYANLDEKTEPDYLCDISRLPVPNDKYDGAILAEVIEHLQYPVDVLKEAYRVLKPGGFLLISTPFVYNVHGDPYDYGRYTADWYKNILSEIGFIEVETQKQGGYFSVIANMIKTLLFSIKDSWPKNKYVKKCIYKLAFWFTKRSLKWDESKFLSSDPVFKGYTTGYGVVAVK